MSNIEWTSETWNPIAGCSKVSEGCKNCYAVKDAHRLKSNPNQKIAEKYSGTTKIENGKMNWTGIINFDEEALLLPLKKKKPTTYFVNSMSDLFHENVEDEWIDKVFGVIAMCPQHTFQILTKRADRMRKYFDLRIYPWLFDHNLDWWHSNHPEFANRLDDYACSFGGNILSNAWLGVSVENQKTADERIPLLLETPAKIRFLSCEPLLEEVHLVDPIVAETWDDADQYHHGDWDYLGHAFVPRKKKINGFSFCKICGNREPNLMHNNSQFKSENTYIDWVIVGGESGNGARPCDISWIRSIVLQCKSANVPVFVKQLGKGRLDYGKVHIQPNSTIKGQQAGFWSYSDSKGGDLAEFPSDLQVREFPR